MEVLLFLAPWVLIGIGVFFVGFSGGPGAARQAYLTGGGRFFRVSMVVLYIATGLAVPAAVIANRDQAQGGTERLSSAETSSVDERGRELFRQTCASCHNLDALNARGVSGPDLDEIGEMTPERVVNAIRNGGTGQKRMPDRLLEGENAEAVGAYVAKVAGK